MVVTTMTNLCFGAVSPAETWLFGTWCGVLLARFLSSLWCSVLEPSSAPCRSHPIFLQFCRGQQQPAVVVVALGSFVIPPRVIWLRGCCCGRGRCCCCCGGVGRRVLFVCSYLSLLMLLCSLFLVVVSLCLSLIVVSVHAVAVVVVLGRFISLDASRPWMVYWILHSLDLLDHFPQEEMTQRILRTVLSCQVKTLAES